MAESMSQLLGYQRLVSWGLIWISVKISATTGLFSPNFILIEQWSSGHFIFLNDLRIPNVDSNCCVCNISQGHWCLVWRPCTLLRTWAIGIFSTWQVTRSGKMSKIQFLASWQNSQYLFSNTCIYMYIYIYSYIFIFVICIHRCVHNKKIFRACHVRYFSPVRLFPRSQYGLCSYLFPHVILCTHQLVHVKWFTKSLKFYKDISSKISKIFV